MSALTTPDAIVERSLVPASPFTIAENDCIIVSNDAVNSEYRLLVAQAQVEGLTIVTRDSEFERYQVAILAA